MVLANSVAVLAALGTLIYTRVLFKRPPITESQERKRLEDDKAAAKDTVASEVTFKAVTVNILPSSTTGADGKAHFCTVSFNLEIRDGAKADRLEAVRPKIEDRLLALLGRKSFDDLNTVQGRYILRAELIDLVNELTGEPLATDVFFTQFIVQ